MLSIEQRRRLRESMWLFRSGVFEQVLEITLLLQLQGIVKRLSCITTFN